MRCLQSVSALLQEERQMTSTSTDESDLNFSRLQIAMDLKDASMRAQCEYRRRAMDALLERIEDCTAMVKDKGYDPAEALRMIAAQCKRIRLIDEALK